MDTIIAFPLVSVIIPNYNHAPFLRERIDSVLNQTYRDFEVIVLDDKSSDNSREVIESYRDNPQIAHIVYNEVNSGSTFKQWQKGFELAKGDYIWIAESDDVAHPDFLKKLIAAIDGDKQVSLAASAITLIDENGNVTGHASISKCKRQRKYAGKDFITENMLLGNHLFNASSAIFRRDVLTKIPKQYTAMKASGDYMFWVELANTGNVIELTEELDYFRRYSKSVTPRLFASGRAFEEAHMVYSRLKELGYAKGYYRHLIVGFRLWQIKKCNTFNSEEIKNKCLAIWEKESNFPMIDRLIFYTHGAFRKLTRAIKNFI